VLRIAFEIAPTRIYPVFMLELTANENHALLILTATVLAFIFSGLHSIAPESQ
jgi:H+/Cl- antiporter ClcA